ncbi:hypothetical protein DIPPA_61679 [Diplonema papillatum]|nr:hypothetical protein DIPPA_61679 [Diplonema papillatum]
MLGMQSQQHRRVRKMQCVATICLASLALGGLLFEMEFEIASNVPEKEASVSQATWKSTEASHAQTHQLSSSGGIGVTVQKVAPPVAQNASIISFGPPLVGILGRLGGKRGLRQKLGAGSELCQMCRPANGNPTPQFCVHESRDLPEPHYEGNQVPVAERFTAVGSTGSTFDVVFVALGKSLHGVGATTGGRQDYVEHAIRQWRIFNRPKESRVFLILADDYVADPAVVTWKELYTVEVVPESSIPLTKHWKRYLEVFYIQGYMHPGGSRKDGNQEFNKLVMQRFHVLHSFVEQRHLTNLVHLENDILLYGNWSELVKPMILCGAELASTFASPKGVIPGIVFIKNAAALEHMVSFVNDLLSCGETCQPLQTKDQCNTASNCFWTKEGTRSYSGGCQPRFGYHLNKVLKMGTYANDMTYFMNYWQYYGARRLSPLPAWEHLPGENCIYDERPHEIYDLASFGQWYSFSPPGREPPRPDKQYVQAMKKERFFDPSPPPYLEWKLDDQGRKIPYWKSYRLLSLHVHAKNLERFISK